jgi:hypothetical protein
MGAQASSTQNSAAPAESAASNNSQSGESCEVKPSDGKKSCKACCACPETKKARDAWYIYIKISFHHCIFLLNSTFNKIASSKEVRRTAAI